MDTIAVSPAIHHTSIRVATASPTAFVDLTEHLQAFVDGIRLRSGLLTVQTRHTTTGIIVNEHEPRLLEDFRELLERLAPTDAEYHHDTAPARDGQPPDAERRNGHAHCRALLLPTSAGLTVIDGRLQLGRWQRVFLLELDGPQEREVSVLAVGECRS